MVPEIKLVISQDGKGLQTVSKQVDTINFMKTIKDFIAVANATLTKMIDEIGGSGDGITEEEEDESDPDEDAPTPKRKKK